MEHVSIMIYEKNDRSILIHYPKKMLAFSQHAFVLGTLQTEELPFG
jgi:hypothetical protein